MDWFTKLIFKPCVTNQVTGDNIVVEDRASLERNFLNKVSYDDVDLFHLNGYECIAKVVKVYDADTVHCIFFINGKAFKFKVRLARVDTAEKNSEDPAEHLWSTKAIQRIEQLIDGKLIWLKCHKWDKYGRLLGELFQYDPLTQVKNKISINQLLINEGLGYEYDGGERREFRDWAPWEAWLDYPNYRPSGKVKPVDNIRDSEVLTEKPVEGVDYQVSGNLSNRK
jgi:endonuclease YncB( thermonuclease family)